MYGLFPNYNAGPYKPSRRSSYQWDLPFRSLLYNRVMSLRKDNDDGTAKPATKGVARRAMESRAFNAQTGMSPMAFASPVACVQVHDVLYNR